MNLKQKLFRSVLLLLIVLLFAVPVSAEMLGDMVLPEVTVEESAPALESAATGTLDFTIYGTYDYYRARNLTTKLNNQRTARGLSTFTMDPTLTNLAMQRAAELAVYYSSTRPDGTTTDDMMNAAGYSNGGAYHLFGGPSTAADAAANIFNNDSIYWCDSSYRSIGVGCYRQDNGTWFWAVIYYTDVVNSGSVPTSAQSKTNIPISLKDAYGDPYLVGFDGTAMYLNAGKSSKVSMYVVNQELGDNYIVYLSGGFTLQTSNKSIASVSGQTVTGVSAGTATIKIVFGDITYSVPYKVSAAVTAPKVTVTNDAATGKIKLSWNKVSNATKYKIYRSKTGNTGTFSLINTVTGTSTINKNAVAGQKYYYYVVAVTANGKTSAKSNVVSRMCDLARPDVSITLTNAGKPKLTWNAVSGATKYQIFRSKTGKDGTFSRIYTVTGTSYTNTNAANYTVYYYKVKAVASNTNANSAFSVKDVISSTAFNVHNGVANKTIITQINNKRANAGVPALTWDSANLMAAKIRAAEIKNKFSTNRPNGTSTDALYTAYGVQYEMILGGSTSAATMVDYVMGRYDLSKVCLDASFTRAVAVRNGSYWAILFR